MTKIILMTFLLYFLHIKSPKRLPLIRKIQLVTGQIYHIFNRSISKLKIFNTAEDYHRFIWTLYAFKIKSSDLKFLQYLKKVRKHNRPYFKETLITAYQPHLLLQVDIICYYIMPNHHHIILKRLIKKIFQNTPMMSKTAMPDILIPNTKE